MRIKLDLQVTVLRVSCRTPCAMAISDESVHDDHQPTDGIGRTVVPHRGLLHADTRCEARHETAIMDVK